MVVLPGGSERRLRRKRDADAAGGARVVGSDFRVFDGRYVAFVSIEGELRAASFDRHTLEIGKAVTLVSGIRRESYQGLGQYDIAENGSLVYALRENAEVGQLMIVHPRSATPMPIPLIAVPAAFQRFDLSPDGRRIAAVIQGHFDQELRVYDLEDKRSRTWLRAPYIGQVLWSQRGERLVVNVGDDSTSALVIGSPDATALPDTLVRAIGREGAPEPMSWRSDSLLIGRVYQTTRKFVALDTRWRSPPVDTVLTDARFPQLSPDGRFLLFTRGSSGELLLTPFPSQSSLSRVTAAEAIEARWVSMTTVRYRTGGAGVGRWFDVTVDSATGRARGEPRLFYSDEQFEDTPGFSHLPGSNGGMIYGQGPARTAAAFLRVVPNWVAKMKHVVDSANAIGR